MEILQIISFVLVISAINGAEIKEVPPAVTSEAAPAVQAKPNQTELSGKSLGGKMMTFGNMYPPMGGAGYMPPQQMSPFYPQQLGGFPPYGVGGAPFAGAGFPPGGYPPYGVGGAPFPGAGFPPGGFAPGGFPQGGFPPGGLPGAGYPGMPSPYYPSPYGYPQSNYLQTYNSYASVGRSKPN